MPKAAKYTLYKVDPTSPSSKPPCAFFKKGDCRNGDKCKFSHGEENESDAQKKTTANKGGTESDSSSVVSSESDDESDSEGEVEVVEDKKEKKGKKEVVKKVPATDGSEDAKTAKGKKKKASSVKVVVKESNDSDGSDSSDDEEDELKMQRELLRKMEEEAGRKKEERKRKKRKEAEKNERENKKKMKKEKQQESSFAYPTTKMPPSSLVEEVYNSHNRAKGTKVAIDEVIVSVCMNENNELKRLQGKIQKTGDEQGKDAIQRARVAVKDIQTRAIIALEEARAEMKKKEEGERQDNPANKKLWQEVATMMATISQLKTEEKNWTKALHDLEAREAQLDSGAVAEQEIANMEEGGEVKPEIVDTVNNEIVPLVGEKIQKSVEDITLAADRIAQVLRGVNELVEDSEGVKKSLYEMYVQDGRMFKGYVQVDNPKGLINGLLK
mmetsp:Transcript_9260/g.18773  ORF Transcript_9260/g.18773 Transcript_9260/m.18773 type:complete len:441 (+) Transcript_9260:89-1411(+)